MADMSNEAGGAIEVGGVDPLEAAIQDRVRELGTLEFNHREHVREYEARREELMDAIRSLAHARPRK